MTDELGNFQTTGLSWKERAEQVIGVAAVYSPDNKYRSQWISIVNSVCLKYAIKKLKKKDVVLDFGCGIGHLTRLLSFSAGKTIGFDLTEAMLHRANKDNKKFQMLFSQIDGVRLPLRDNTLDLIWVCGVLRYSLLIPNPRHKEIAGEFYRVLKPGGWIINLEMYVDLPSSVFFKDFIDSGFLLNSLSVVHVKQSVFDKAAEGKFRHIFMNKYWATISVWITQIMVKEKHQKLKIRDYLFQYQKPK